MNIKSTIDNILKIVIVGESGVGKTNFLFRFIEGKYLKIVEPTLGTDFKSKICTLPKSKKKVKMNLWDTAGQERYMSLNKIFFQRVQGIMLMYDITNRESYEKLPKWVKFINEQAYNVPVILVGNKIDDENENRIVRKEEGKDFAKQNGYLFYEASALNGKNVNNTFYSLCESCISKLEESIVINGSASTSLMDYFSIQKKKKKSKEEYCC
jgi:small GTP-binding protein